MSRTLRNRVIVTPPSARTRQDKVLKSQKARTTKKTAKQGTKKTTEKSTAQGVTKHKNRVSMLPKQKRQRKPRPHKNAIPPPEPLVPTILPDAPYRAPKNPRATFLGLPTELRLQIYTYLQASSLIHIHKHWSKHPSLIRVLKYTWTPCKAAHPTYPLLCANPKYSGLCAERDRCTVHRDAPLDLRGLHALGATSKFLRAETHEYRVATSGLVMPLDVDAENCLGVFRDVAPKRMAAVRRITLIGVQGSEGFRSCAVDRILAHVPQLEALGLQVQSPTYPWFDSTHLDEANVQNVWSIWKPLTWVSGWRGLTWIPYDGKGVPRHLTVVIEGTIWVEGLKGQVLLGESWWTPERQVVVRVVREGKGQKVDGMLGTLDGWREEDIRLEVMDPRGLVEPRKTAAWRKWWDTPAHGGFRE